MGEMKWRCGDMKVCGWTNGKCEGGRDEVEMQAMHESSLVHTYKKNKQTKEKTKTKQTKTTKKKPKNKTKQNKTTTTKRSDKQPLPSPHSQTHKLQPFIPLCFTVHAHWCFVLHYFPFVVCTCVS